MTDAERLRAIVAVLSKHRISRTTIGHSGLDEIKILKVPALRAALAALTEIVALCDTRPNNQN